MVRTRVRGQLRLRKQNTKTTVPLDVVPERRTEPFPPRFGLVGRFCELRFSYLSSPTGREGEISRPLNHIFFETFIEYPSQGYFNKIIPKKANKSPSN